MWPALLRQLRLAKHVSLDSSHVSSGQQALGQHLGRAWGLVKLELHAPKSPDELNGHRLGR